MVVILSCTYILCVYKTVTIASHYEKGHTQFVKLQEVVGEKEHVYIQKTANIDMDQATMLGYEKNTKTMAYINTSKDIQLAVR